MNFQEYRQYDAIGLAKLVKEKQVSPNDLLDLASHRVAKVNPKINAVVHQLYDYAKKMLDAMPRNGLFSGVPLLVKDLGLQVKNTPLNVGSFALKDNVSQVDSVVVQKLRNAGFLIFGKTNTPEFGLTTWTESKLYGNCYNPWNLEHSPGGSSGGAGAAVAAGISPLATASDGGGSIRIPASCCGLLGMKPSRGHSSFRPFAAEFWSGLVQEGCVSWSVRDTAAYLDTIAGTDIGEFYLAKNSDSALLQAIEQPVRKLKIGFSTEHTLGHQVDTDCQDAVQHAAKLLRSLGHDVEEVELPYQREDITKVFVVIVAAETAGDLNVLESLLGRKLKRNEIEPNTWALRVLGNAFSAGEYAFAKAQVGNIAYRLGQWHQQYDVLLTPTLANAPIKTGALQNSKAEAQLVKIVNTFNLGKLVKASLEQFADKAFGYFPYTPLSNMTGQPSVNIPLYWSPKGLPIGTLFTAKIGDDALLLQLAKQLEEAQAWFDKIPDL